MAKIRVYELARALNMDNKTLLDKLNEMDITVQSHMSSLEEETVEKIKSGLLGKKVSSMEEVRINPGLIRRRKRMETLPEVDRAEATLEVLADTGPAVSGPPVEEPAVPDQIPEQVAPRESHIPLPEPSEESMAVSSHAPGKVKDDSMPVDEEFAADFTERVSADANAAPVESMATHAVEDDTEIERDETDRISEESLETVESESLVPEVELSEAEQVSGIGQEDRSASSEPLKDAEKEVAAEGAGELAEAAGPAADKPAEPAGAEISPLKLKPQKPSKKGKKVKRDTPAKIIKLPTKMPETPAPESEEVKEALEVIKPAAEEQKVFPSPGQAEAPVTEEAEDKQDKKKKKKVKSTEKEEESDLDRKFLKKKISFRRKEVVESEELYEDAVKTQKLKKGVKAKPIKAHKTLITTPKAIKRRIKIDETIVLSDLAKRMGIKANEMIGKLMMMGIMTTVNQTIDYETASLVAVEFGYELEKASFEEETILKVEADDPDKLAARPPVVTIMGHVDHGKTSLLDVIRKTRVTENEAGGITQHIGAYVVNTNRGDVVFLDTPGHEAFTAMRARGAKITDIVVLVVAADDGVMPQTIEAINHARASNVPIIVAINKIDKANADPDRVTRQLAEIGLTPEDWGGQTIFVKVSAKKNIGIDELLEMILLQSEIMELQSNPNKLARGHLIEAKLDSGRGPVATVLVQDGSLRLGDAVVCGVHHGRIRAMLNHLGQNVDQAGPSIPVEILGLSGVPMAGDEMIALVDEKDAKMVSSYRMQKQRNIELAKTSRLSLEKLFERMKEEELKELDLIIKADVIGSLEALRDSLIKLSNEQVKINLVHGATGTITESDVSLAAVSNAIIIGFNVRPAQKVIDYAQEENVDMRFYNIIYNVIKDVKDAIVGMMSSTYNERVLGRAEVRQTFTIPKVGTIAGCYVVSGKIERNQKIRVIRDGIVGYEGKVISLRRFKEDFKEVAAGYECGIGIENYNDLKVGDILECFFMEEVRPELT
jgi:translation initiation factor IF-2